jgi:hypothetical protein
MSATMRFLGVAVSGVMLFGCAATTQNLNPKPPASAAIKDPNCLTETGSRVSSKSGCRGYGRSYSYDDMQRTGSFFPAESLSILDS